MKLYTNREIQKELGVSNNVLNNIAKRYEIRRVRKSHDPRTGSYYSEAQFQWLKKYVEARNQMIQIKKELLTITKEKTDETI